MVLVLKYVHKVPRNFAKQGAFFREIRNSFRMKFSRFLYERNSSTGKRTFVPLKKLNFLSGPNRLKRVNGAYRWQHASETRAPLKISVADPDPKRNLTFFLGSGLRALNCIIQILPFKPRWLKLNQIEKWDLDPDRNISCPPPPHCWQSVQGGRTCRWKRTNAVPYVSEAHCRKYGIFARVYPTGLFLAEISINPRTWIWTLTEMVSPW